jgi:hypothetical protein
MNLQAVNIPPHTALYYIEEKSWLNNVARTEALILNLKAACVLQVYNIYLWQKLFSEWAMRLWRRNTAELWCVHTQSLKKAHVHPREDQERKSLRREGGIETGDDKKSRLRSPLIFSLASSNIKSDVESSTRLHNGQLLLFTAVRAPQQVFITALLNVMCVCSLALFKEKMRCTQTSCSFGFNRNANRFIHDVNFSQLKPRGKLKCAKRLRIYGFKNFKVNASGRRNNW